MGTGGSPTAAEKSLARWQLGTTSRRYCSVRLATSQFADRVVTAASSEPRSARWRRRVRTRTRRGSAS